MASSETRETIENVNVDVTQIENGFKKDKARAKSNFTRSQNRLLLLLEEQDTDSRISIIEACKKLEGQKEHKKCERIVGEMLRIEEDFDAASKATREYLASRKDGSASVSSSAEKLTVNVRYGMNISEKSSETYINDHVSTEPLQESREVGISQDISQNNDPVPVPIENRQYSSLSNAASKLSMKEVPVKDRMSVTSFGGLENAKTSQHGNSLNMINNDPVMNARAASFEPRDQFHREPSVQAAGQTASYNSPSIGQDLWRQLKRVQIPVFSGDKRTYNSWKVAFLACIDSAPATGEYELLQLRQYLAGEALKTIENLGHSGAAYEAAKERLERKFGGMRRQIAIYMEKLENFRQIRNGNAKDLEQFADLLDIAIINLRETDQHHELGSGSLYSILQRKLPQSMLTSYHRWVFDNNVTQSVVTLRKWVIQESEFLTVASETVYGVAGRASDAQTTPQKPGQRNTRTFFGDNGDNRAKKTQCCQTCGTDHRIWTCQAFKQKGMAEKWEIAKRCKLCFRCLAGGHSGKTCPRSRQCGLNGCKELYHRLLHRPSETEPKSTDQNGTDNQASGTQITSGSEGNKNLEQTTMTASNVPTAEFIALRTVPVILKNGDRSLKVNALLYDASTKTYVDSDVAAQLGLQGKTERVTVNVLNGQVETFETRPVYVELESLTGDVKLGVAAYTATRVVGSMKAFDWTEYTKR